MSNDVFNLKLGNNNFQDYDHNTGKFTKPEKIENKKILFYVDYTLF